MSRALSPRTLTAYNGCLGIAFPKGNYTLAGLDKKAIEHWGNSSLNQLKCALRWKRKSQGLPPKDVMLEDFLQPKHAIQRQPYTPAEMEIQALERAVANWPHHEKAAVSILLYLGLRAEEFYSLSRATVQRATNTGLLTFIRKGAREHTLDVSKVTSYFDSLLLVPARHPPGTTPTKSRAWKTVGEVFSSGKPMSQYHVLRRLVMRAAKQAGLPHLSPHKLRHAFATRLNRDGASAFIIQAALNHKNITTAARYTHASAEDVSKFMRGPGGGT